MVYVTSRLSVNGILLVAMSSLVRAHLPWCGKRKSRKSVAPVSTVVMVEPSPRSPTFQLPGKATQPEQSRVKSFSNLSEF